MRARRGCASSRCAKGWDDENVYAYARATPRRPNGEVGARVTRLQYRLAMAACFVGLVVVWCVAIVCAVLLVTSCAAPKKPPAQPAPEPLLVVVPVPCMDDPPPLFVPDWPPPDRLGNVLFHWSTVEKTRDALVGQRRYIDEQLAKCRNAALEQEIRAQEGRP